MSPVYGMRCVCGWWCDIIASPDEIPASVPCKSCGKPATRHWDKVAIGRVEGAGGSPGRSS